MEALARFAVRRPVAVTVLAAAVVLLGLVAAGRLPVDLLPDLESPTVVVSLRAGDRPPLEMERLYGEQLERRLFTVQGIRDVTQVARTGRVVATVTFSWDTDMDLALVEVQKAVGPLEADPEVDELIVRRFDPRQAPILEVGMLAAGEDGPGLVELRRLARRQVAPALERLPGVAEVRVLGGREPEVRVEVDPYRMESWDLDLGTIGSRLRSANVDIDAGTLEEGDTVYVVRGISRFRDLDDLRRVVLAFRSDASGRRVAVRLRDVARVRWGEKEITHLVRVNGREGVALQVYKEAGANTVAVSREVHRALGRARKDLPRVRLVAVADEADYVQRAIRDVETAALVGILLAVLVLVVFLRSAAPTLLVSAAVPVSLLATLFLMGLAGESLNVMTLGGLALGAGMLVDNAIVVVEAIWRRLAAGAEPTEAAARGTGEVAGAIVASTLTTCVVFVPIFFVRGFAARLVGGLAFTVVVSLLASLGAAVLLVPALARWFLPRGRARGVDPGAAAVTRVVDRLLARPLVVVAIAVVLSGASVLVLRSLGTELLPPADPAQFSARLVGPPAQGVRATARAVEVLEGILRQAAGKNLAGTLAEVGRVPEDDRLVREEQAEENTARLVARLVPDGPRAREVIAAAAPAVARLAGQHVGWELGGSGISRTLGTSGPPIVVEVSGLSLPEIRRTAARLAEALAARDELWNVRSSLEGGPPEILVRLDPGLADALGVSLRQVTDTLAAALDGKQVTTFVEGDEERDVVLRVPGVPPDRLGSLVLRLPGGGKVALADVATFEERAGEREIRRRDQRRIALVTARVRPGVANPRARAAVRAVLSGFPFPPGVRARLAGEEEERARTVRELGLALALAVLLVLMVLAGSFESLVHPLTVLAAIPFSLVGVAAVLGPGGHPIGVMALLGLVLLAGIAVNDAILLVATARRLVGEGVPRREALARAAGIRWRPILMTTATTVLAMLPLALGGGAGAELRAPLAITVIGGLLASTTASVLVVPCLYLVLDRLAHPRRAREEGEGR